MRGCDSYHKISVGLLTTEISAHWVRKEELERKYALEKNIYLIQHNRKQPYSKSKH